MNEGFKKYKEANYSSSIRKTKQIVMLYDGIIKFIKLAAECIDKKDIEMRYNYTEKAIKIIDGLHASLNMKEGKEVAQLLNNFYLSLHYKIVQINIKNDKNICEKVITELKTMRDAWDDVDKKMHNNNIDYEKQVTNLSFKGLNT